MIYLKDFIKKFALEKEIKLYGVTVDRVRDAERKMERNRKEIDRGAVLDELKRIQQLDSELEDKDWEIIEKEIGKMK